MRSRARSGFTLIEMMVAMALTLLVMTILSQAFIMALNTFSGMKALGDMQSNLRTAMNVMRADLAANHFEGDRRLSDANIYQADGTPDCGFFVVKQGAAKAGPAAVRAPALYWQEGTDSNGLPSYITTDHFLYFTVRRNGNRPENFFTTYLNADKATLTNFFGQSTGYNLTSSQVAAFTLTPPYPGGATAFYSSQWAEVYYYLVLNPFTEWAAPNDPGGVTVPTFSLYRAQFVMAPNADPINNIVNSGVYNPAASPAFAGMACNSIGGATLTFFSPFDAARPSPVYSRKRTLNPNTFTSAYHDPNVALPARPSEWPAGQWPPPALPTRLQQGNATLVLANVVSFEVGVMRQSSVVNDLNFYSNANQPNLTTDGALYGILYDTTLFDTTQPAAATYQNRFGLKGIQITLRVWDGASRQTRQSSMVLDL